MSIVKAIAGATHTKPNPMQEPPDGLPVSSQNCARWQEQPRDNAPDVYTRGVLEAKDRHNLSVGGVMGVLVITVLCKKGFSWTVYYARLA